MGASGKTTATFPRSEEDRKCEKLWTLPLAVARKLVANMLAVERRKQNFVPAVGTGQLLSYNDGS